MAIQGGKPDKRKTILICAAVALVVSGLFPPWLHTIYRTGTRDHNGVRSETSAGYRLIFAPPSPLMSGGDSEDALHYGIGVKLDTHRLLVEWVCILAAGGAALGLAQLYATATTPGKSTNLANYGFKRRLTVGQAEAKHMVTDSRLGPAPVPFGFCNPQWKELLDKMQPGDDLWEFSDSDDIALVRNGNVLAAVTTAV